MTAECKAILSDHGDRREVCVLPLGHDLPHGTVTAGTAVIERVLPSPCGCVEATFREPAIHESETASAPEQGENAAAALSVIQRLADEALNLSTGRPVDALLQIRGVAKAAQLAPDAAWEPTDEHIEAATRLVRNHGGALAVTRNEIVYLASDDGRQLRAAVWSDDAGITIDSP